MSLSLNVTGTGVSGYNIPKSGTISLKFSTSRTYIQGPIYVYAINSYGSILMQVDAYQYPAAGLSWEPWDNDGHALEIGDYWNNGKYVDLSSFSINLNSLVSYFSSYSDLSGILIEVPATGRLTESFEQTYTFTYWLNDPYLSSVTGLSASQLDNGYVRIKWNACTGSYGTTNITYYIRLESSTGTQIWSGSANSVDLSISNKFSYGKSYKIYVVATYSGISEYNYVNRTFTAPYITAPTNLKLTKTLGRSTTLSWSTASLKYTSSSSGITYTILKDGDLVGTSTSTSFDITEDIAREFGTDPVTLTVKASATNLTNTYSGPTLNKTSSGVSFTYSAITACTSPTTFLAVQSLSYIPVNLEWSGAEDGIENTITAYHIQYQDCADGTSWPSTWIDLETNWPASPLEVFPPDTIGYYRRFRIQVKGSAGEDYYSDWLISSNILRKDMAPFEGFTDSELTALSTKIKAIHMTEMQNRINEILIFEGKQPYAFTQIVAGQTKLTGWTNHVNELRSALNQLDNLTVEWIEILENRPRADVINQIRNVINLYN